MGCARRADANHTTCSDPEHRKLEIRGVEAHTAMFQLRKRLERLKIYHPDGEEDGESGVDDGSKGLSTGEVTEITSDDHPDKPDGGNTKLRARFGRRRTHNEQLCVSTCGIIFGRMTMYGSEGVNGVRVRNQPHYAY